MSETTYKSGRKKGFVVLFRDVAQDARLSLEARGLFAMMVSLPENWNYSVSGLAGKAGCGKDKIRRLLKELQEVGYLIREQSHDGGGKFSGNVYVLQDEAPLSGNTDNGENRQRLNPMTVFPTLKNKEYKENIEERAPYSPPGGGRRVRKSPRTAPDWCPDRFEGLWKYYPKQGRKDKQRAMDEWDKLAPDAALIDTIALALQTLNKHDEQWRRGIGIPYLHRFLRDRRWEDAEETSESDARQSDSGWADDPEVI